MRFRWSRRRDPRQPTVSRSAATADVVSTREWRAQTTASLAPLVAGRAWGLRQLLRPCSPTRRIKDLEGWVGGGETHLCACARGEMQRRRRGRDGRRGARGRRRRDEVVGEEVTGVELVRAAPSRRRRLPKRMTGIVRRSHRGSWAAWGKQIVVWGTLGRTTAGPHKSLALLWICLISTIPPIERVGTCLINVFVDILLLSPTSPVLVRHQGKLFASHRSDEGSVYGSWGWP